VALTLLGGGGTSVNALLARGKPLLLVITDPRCGPCYELLPDVAGWQRVYGDRLSIALVSTGDPGTNQAMTAEYGIHPVLLQRERELIEAYKLVQAPAAVLISPDGRIEGEARYGTWAIRQLVADTLGLVMPPPPVLANRAVGVGEAVPSLRRPDLDGNVIDLGASRGATTLVLFWNPGCSHCQELLPDVRAFEAQQFRPQLVIVSRGPVGLNREVGFASRMVLDDDRSIATAFGVTGTPAAVLIDRSGVVGSPVARGATGVRALLERLNVSALTATG
jgi:thiol-disulfide isomerase/thioredoxin